MSHRKKEQTANIAVVPVLVAILTLVLAASHGPVRSAKAAGSIEKRDEAVYHAGSSFFQASLTASDIDADGKDEILAGNTNGFLYCFDSRTRLKWKFNAGASIQGAPACFDVDGDGRKEIWVGDMNGVMWGLDCYGRPLTKWGWPMMTSGADVFAGIFSSPAVGDVNGDGLAEIVVGTYGHQVCVWRYTGEVLAGWPYDNQDTIWSSPAIADVDWDGLNEIVIGADSTGGHGSPYPRGGLLYVFNGDGSIVPGFPRTTPEVTWSSPAVADIDGDGRYEIVVGTGHFYKAIRRLTTEGQMVYAYKSDGRNAPGWPAFAAGSTFSSPAIGDVNGDGNLEIAIASNSVYGIGEDRIQLYRSNGKLVFSKGGLGGPMMASPVLGDVDSDGKPDIIVGSGNYICAWNSDGHVIWKRDLGNFVLTTPVVGDFDRDGRVEVALGTGDAPDGAVPGGDFYVFDLGPKAASKGSGANLFPWPQFRLNAQHTATELNGNEPLPPQQSRCFQEYLLLFNPGLKKAHARVEFVNEAGQRVYIPWAINPLSRSTIHVNRFMQGCGVSGKVVSDIPIVAERSMYFDFAQKWKGGTNSRGSATTSRNWYLPEGHTDANFDDYVLIMNPQGHPVGVTVSFQRENGSSITHQLEIAPASRFTLNAKSVPGLENASFSTSVAATAGVVCERSMYFDYEGMEGGHSSMGATGPARRWYLAEGYSAQSFDTYVLVQNPGGKSATIDMFFLRKDGYQGKVSFVMPGLSRKTVKANDVPGFSTAEFSVEVRSNRGVIAERAMYFNVGGRDGGSDSMGSSSVSSHWYFAEGYTAGSFDTYILIMNPQTKPTRVRTTFARDDGYTRSRVDDVRPRSRFTIHVDETPGFEDTEVSTRVEALDGAGVVAERAMYFDYDNQFSDGHDSVGVDSPSTTWYFAEGYTGF